MRTRDIFSFGESEPLDYPVEQGLLRYHPDWMGGTEAGAVYQQLAGALNWQEERVRIAGRWVDVPRLVCWYGEENAVYCYSGVKHTPSPWNPLLLTLRHRLENFCGQQFNSVLGNYYRSGQDSMGWHSDDEPELGDEPFIASLSLGAERRFRIRHKKTGTGFDIPLAHGSLLLMGGSLQRHYRHCLPKCSPKTQTDTLGRINLTFRFIHPEKLPA